MLPHREHFFDLPPLVPWSRLARFHLPHLLRLPAGLRGRPGPFDIQPLYQRPASDVSLYAPSEPPAEVSSKGLKIFLITSLVAQISPFQPFAQISNDCVRFGVQAVLALLVLVDLDFQWPSTQLHSAEPPILCSAICARWGFLNLRHVCNVFRYIVVHKRLVLLSFHFQFVLAAIT